MMLFLDPPKKPFFKEEQGIYNTEQKQILSNPQKLGLASLQITPFSPT